MLNQAIRAKIKFDIDCTNTNSDFLFNLFHFFCLVTNCINMAKANFEVTQLQKNRRMRNCRKKRKREQRAAAEEAMTQKISGAVKDQKVLAEKYYSKWKNISKKADELRRRIPAQSHTRKILLILYSNTNLNPFFL